MHDKLTKADIEKMQEEIDHRKLVVRPQALEDLKAARAQGDLSENFEYHAAKQYKNQNESRIRYLENMIRTAVIVEDHSAADEVGLQKQVTVQFEDEDEPEIFKIVTSVRGNSQLGSSHPNPRSAAPSWGTAPETAYTSTSAAAAATKLQS
jgi:transcription elongation factor GreA